MLRTRHGTTTPTVTVRALGAVAALRGLGAGRRVVIRLTITSVDTAGNRRTLVRFVPVRR